MKKRIALGIAMLLVLAVVIAPVALGQGSTMSTAFAVQNLGTGSATVSVEFRDTNGNLTNTLNQVIAEGQNYNFDQRYDSGNPGTEPFQGSAIVSSGNPIGAVANMMRSGGAAPGYESYNAITPTGTGLEVLLPQILKNVSSGGLVWNTTIVVQNTDTANSANVQLIFTRSHPQPGDRWNAGLAVHAQHQHRGRRNGLRQPGHHTW